MMKKAMAGVGIAAAAAILATALIAGAQTTTPTQPQILQVGKEGRVLMRGTIASVASSSLTVNSWGGPWTVNVGSGAQVLPFTGGQGAGNTLDLTQFKVGDFVGVLGTVSTSGNWTIDATLVRDWTYRQALNQERQQNIQENVTIHHEGLAPRNYVGTITSDPLETAVGWSFGIKIDGINYTVNVPSSTEVVGLSWLTLLPGRLKSGDIVGVWGVNASGTITAQIVRDHSIPAVATSSVQEQLRGAPRH